MGGSVAWAKLRQGCKGDVKAEDDARMRDLDGRVIVRSANIVTRGELVVGLMVVRDEEGADVDVLSFGLALLCFLGLSKVTVKVEQSLQSKCDNVEGRGGSRRVGRDSRRVGRASARRRKKIGPRTLGRHGIRVQ